MADVFFPDGRLRSECFTSEALRALGAAVEAAQETCWESLRSPHVFMGILASPDAQVKKWARKVRIDLKAWHTQFLEAFTESADEPRLSLHREFCSDNALRLLREAQERARAAKQQAISCMDLLVTALATAEGVVAEFLKHSGAKVEAWISAAEQLE